MFRESFWESSQVAWIRSCIEIAENLLWKSFQARYVAVEMKDFWAFVAAKNGVAAIHANCAPIFVGIVFRHCC